MDNEAKLRPLYLLKVLYEQTDEDNYLTTTQISSILEEKYGLKSHRQTIKSDIELLKEFGFEIQETKSTQNRYNIFGRIFDLAELKLLMDAVESSKFISTKRSKELLEKLASLAGEHAAETLQRNISCEGRIKTDNERTFLIVDAINEAINKNKQISFQYFQYDIRKEKKLRQDGQSYILSPYHLVWNGDYYYVVGYSEKHKLISTFRVDRIAKSPTILEDKDAIPMPKDFSIDEYINTTFRMFNSSHEEVELICDNSLMDAIIDRFGEDVTTYANDMESFRVVANIAVSHVFFSWVFGFGGKVKIKSPENIKNQYAEMVKNALANLE